MKRMRLTRASQLESQIADIATSTFLSSTAVDMSNPKSTRAVYKTVGTQEIDVDVYLPPQSDVAHPIRQCAHSQASRLCS